MSNKFKSPVKNSNHYKRSVKSSDGFRQFFWKGFNAAADGAPLNVLITQLSIEKAEAFEAGYNANLCEQIEFDGIDVGIQLY